MPNKPLPANTVRKPSGRAVTKLVRELTDLDPRATIHIEWHDDDGAGWFWVTSPALEVK